MEIDPNDFKQLIGLLQKLVENNNTKTQNNESNEINQEEEIAEEVSPIKTSKRKLSPSKNKKGEFVNKFLSMRESSMHKSDAEIDKKLSKYPPTQRSREFKLVDVRCRVCGKTEQVPPGLVESINRYKCNKCSTSPG
jgi:hypothetical protein